MTGLAALSVGSAPAAYDARACASLAACCLLKIHAPITVMIATPPTHANTIATMSPLLRPLPLPEPVLPLVLLPPVVEATAAEVTVVLTI